MYLVLYVRLHNKACRHLSTLHLESSLIWCPHHSAFQQRTALLTHTYRLLLETNQEKLWNISIAQKRPYVNDRAFGTHDWFDRNGIFESCMVWSASLRERSVESNNSGLLTNLLHTTLSIGFNVPPRSSQLISMVYGLFANKKKHKIYQQRAEVLLSFQTSLGVTILGGTYTIITDSRVARHIYNGGVTERDSTTQHNTE